jgi:hypothetical protein
MQAAVVNLAGEAEGADNHRLVRDAGRDKLPGQLIRRPATRARFVGNAADFGLGIVGAQIVRRAAGLIGALIDVDRHAPAPLR